MHNSKMEMAAKGQDGCLCHLCEQARGGRSMVKCDVCHKWFHFHCLAYSDDAQKETLELSAFVCFLCVDASEEDVPPKETNKNVVSE